MGKQSHATRLETWFSRVARDLPWRKTRDPYRIWLSEVMLQQTQVATVLPYYAKFLDKFPTVEALANAPLETVLVEWAGLGYYSRARNLQRGARYLVDSCGGVFPQSLEEARKVPGVGPYTAGAVLSIAYDLAVPLVDGNVQRVLSRFFALPDLLESKRAGEFFWKTAERWVLESQSPRAFNQALMELGATICTKAAPRCHICPIAADCRAKKQGTPEAYPKRKPRRQTVPLFWGSLIFEKQGKVFLVQNPEGEWWRGLWDFPRFEASNADTVQVELENRIASAPGTRLHRSLGWQRHTVTHHRIHVAPFVLGCSSKPRLPSGKWLGVAQVSQLPLSSLAKKILNAYLAG